VTTLEAISIHKLAEYAIYNKVDVVVVSDSRFDQRMMALAFGVMCDELLPECGEYHSQPRRLDLEIGSRVYFKESRDIEQLRSHNLHGVVFDTTEGIDGATYRLAKGRCRNEKPMGVRFLGR
jgi:hypothetical protein